ncbi:CvpA family protein [Streptococcus dentasini]
MISLIVLLLLAWQFYIGYRRGLFLQVFYFIGSLFAIVVAFLFKNKLADILNLWVPYANPTEGAEMQFFTSENIFGLNRLYYAGVAFLLLYLTVYLIWRFFGIFAHVVSSLRLEMLAYQQLLAGGLAVFVALFSLGAFLTVLATLPITGLQNMLADSWLIKVLVVLFPKFLLN